MSGGEIRHITAPDSGDLRTVADERNHRPGLVTDVQERKHAVLVERPGSVGSERAGRAHTSSAEMTAKRTLRGFLVTRRQIGPFDGVRREPDPLDE